MSDSRPIVAADNNNDGYAIINWTQVPNDEIRYDTDDEEEVMKAKLKERKRQKAAEQAQQEEQAWLEAKRVEREWIEAERAERERVKAKACEKEERWEAEHKHKAKASKGDEAGTGATGGEDRGEVKRVVMDPGCTRCSWAKVICKFLIDSNKKQVACMCCNQSKGKCQWPGDGKDAEGSPKAASKVNKGKKRKADDEMPEPGPSQKKWAKSKLIKVLEIDEPEASGSGARKAITGGFSGLEDKLEWLINVTGLITNNLAGLFELQEAAVENSGSIADMLEAIIDESYGFRVVVIPSDLGLSKLDSDELHEEAEWLQAEGEEEEAEGEDEPMAE
ncbi:hypothetical protein M404DRAFT_34819 [Pisolithus tinctorius Marx 270]|uniref:Uncharacterized protein n=1 Tax=Pisolithus tinctorius Marx 270 TaxID=870435 RepID=A0A0C3NGQ2_PISTI|nr:hypothetical protein M404DRAFT_34819 [Pisolithus tinctorius Marx 270]